ncbi:MAG: hypothetical protein FE834_02935 [Gammaproteobacteria bacterium]|nr:hypothetical protein [Gammaproteobacteria bacterium]
MYGIPITAYEQRLIDKNTPLSRVIFWHSRNSRNDPFAPTALDVVANRGFGILANALSPINNKQLGLNLLTDYGKWIDRDFADMHPDNQRGVLSNDQITDWHDFSFGRTPWASMYLGKFGRESWVCSPSCDSYNPKQ